MKSSTTQVKVNKPNGVGPGRIWRAQLCSLRGLGFAWRFESAFRQEAILALVMLPLSFLVAQSVFHWAMLVATLLLVLLTELINSAIEALADAVTLDHHPLIGRAKDIGSAAVFISLSITVIVWGAAIGEPLLQQILS